MNKTKNTNALWKIETKRSLNGEQNENNNVIAENISYYSKRGSYLRYIISIHLS